MMQGQAATPLPRYKCHKEVCALKIKVVEFDCDHPERARSNIGNGTLATIVPTDEGYAPFRVGHEYLTKHRPEKGGYFVVYKDGYQSYSPAKAFEDGYTRID
jgi:hypothetical protein